MLSPIQLKQNLVSNRSGWLYYQRLTCYIEYNIALELIPKLEQLEKESVQAAEKENDLNKALDLINQCIQLEPKYASAYNNRYKKSSKGDKLLITLLEPKFIVFYKRLIKH